MQKIKTENEMLKRKLQKSEEKRNAQKQRLTSFRTRVTEVIECAKSSGTWRQQLQENNSSTAENSESEARAERRSAM